MNTVDKQAPGRTDRRCGGPKTGLRNFTGFSFRNEQRREMPCFTMTRDGFSLLAMGFIGTKALRWKARNHKSAAI
jgi:Rha family phage regulatory protein